MTHSTRQSFAPARLERGTLDNGLRVLYRQDTTFPLATGTFLFPAGSRRETPAQAGLCSMTVDLLVQGTRRRNARELARVMESVGASLGTQVHEDYSEIGFVAPSAKMDRAFGVAAEILEQPSFVSGEIAKEKAHVLAALASRRDAIFNVAYDPFNRLLYGSHPYGRPLEGSETTVRSFTRGAFRAWHRQALRPEQGILSLVSPYSFQDVSRRLRNTIGAWRQPAAGEKPAAFAPPVVSLRASRSGVIRSSFEQAYLMTGWLAPGAADEDQIPLKVLNTLLGGGMSSRLFVTLREKLGLAYEVSSFYPTRLDQSQWVIYLGLPIEKLATASRKLNNLLELLANTGPNLREVRQAKAMIRGAFLMDRQSRRRQAWYAAWWEFLCRGAAYGDEFLEGVDAVTPQRLRDLLRRIMAQPRVTVTVIPK